MATYKLISSYTVGAGGINEISFTSIPQTYTDLVLVWSLRGSQSGGVLNVNVKINGIGTSTYREKMVRAYNNGTSYAQDNTGPAWEYNYATPNDNVAGSFASSYYYICDYTNTNSKKAANSHGAVLNAAGTTHTHFQWNAYSNHSITDAISSIGIRNGASDLYLQYSTAYLYGISKA